MKKKVLALTLATVVFAMTGCGSTTAEVSTEETPATEAPAAETPAAETPATEEASQDADLVFGTANLSYAEFYSGDVSATDSYDAVSSATNKKYEMFPNMNTDFVDETTNAEGYKILGVKNVNVAVPADQVDAYTALNDSFVKTDAAPAQYKTVSVENGVATYSATVFNVAATVTDAKAELLTGTNWGDYQLNILEESTSYIRNTREDEGFAVSRDIQGIILETESGLKVGMEHLQSIWVQPYEISFNIAADNSHNQRVKFDNLDELSKLEEEKIVSVTFINPNDAYVYNFDPVYVKPVYRDVTVTGKIDETTGEFTLSEIPEGLENAALTMTYIVGKGHDAVRTALYDGALDDATVKIDAEALAEAKKAQTEEGSYTVAISSDNYANIAVTVEE